MQAHVADKLITFCEEGVSSFPASDISDKKVRYSVSVAVSLTDEVVDLVANFPS